MKTHTYVVSIIFTGDPVAVESCIEMLIESIDFSALDTAEIVVRNETEVTDD